MENNNILLEQTDIKQFPTFDCRRMVERLRDGLSDPLAIRILSANISRLNDLIEQNFRAMNKENEKNRKNEKKGTASSNKKVRQQSLAPHLCLIGNYGQGKSHSLAYIEEKSIGESWVTSLVNLDPRQCPLTNIKTVCRSVYSGFRFAGSRNSLLGKWRLWGSQNFIKGPQLNQQIWDFLPLEMPALYKAILTASLLSHFDVEVRSKKRLRARFSAKQEEELLNRAMAGEAVPVAHLKRIFRERGVFECSGNRGKEIVPNENRKIKLSSLSSVDDHLNLLVSYAQLMRKMGYSGLVLLFDEGESITQGSIIARSKAYEIFYRLLNIQGQNLPLYVILAFTDDFFFKVNEEDFNRTRVKKGKEELYFQRNYLEEWKDLKTYRIPLPSKKHWQEISTKLIECHFAAYQWNMQPTDLLNVMSDQYWQDGLDMRITLKSMVEALDIVHQSKLFDIEEQTNKACFN